MVVVEGFCFVGVIIMIIIILNDKIYISENHEFNISYFSSSDLYNTL